MIVPAKMSIVHYLARPFVSASQCLHEATKLRQVLSKRDSVKTALALRRKQPDLLNIEGNDFHLRKDTTDRYTFCDVFLHDSLQTRNLITDPRLIVDCGAHIGCASLFFTLRYPDARIVSIEPDKDNYQILTRNLGSLENVTTINAAVWNESAPVEIANPGTSPTGLYVKESDPQATDVVRGVTISEILNDCPELRIDILKLDVEGAERRLFSSDSCHDWLPKIRVLIVELHDRLLPGCSKTLFRALDRYDYEYHECNGCVAVIEMKHIV